MMKVKKVHPNFFFKKFSFCPFFHVCQKNLKICHFAPWYDYICLRMQFYYHDYESALYMIKYSSFAWGNFILVPNSAKYGNNVHFWPLKKKFFKKFTREEGGGFGVIKILLGLWKINSYQSPQSDPRNVMNTQCGLLFCSHFITRYHQTMRDWLGPWL